MALDMCDCLTGDLADWGELLFHRSLLALSLLVPTPLWALDLSDTGIPHISGEYSIRFRDIRTVEIEFRIDDVKALVDGSLAGRDFDERCRNDTFWDGLQEVEAAEGSRVAIRARLSINLWVCDDFFGNNRIAPEAKPTFAAWVYPEIVDEKIVLRAEVQNVEDVAPWLENLASQLFHIDLSPVLMSIENEFTGMRLVEVSFIRLDSNRLSGVARVELF